MAYVATQNIYYSRFLSENLLGLGGGVNTLQKENPRYLDRCTMDKLALVWTMIK